MLSKRIQELDKILSKTTDRTLYLKEYMELLECSKTINKNNQTDLDTELLKLRLFEHRWKQLQNKTLDICSTLLLELEHFRNNYEILDLKIDKISKDKHLYEILMVKIRTKNHELTDIIYDYCETIFR